MFSWSAAARKALSTLWRQGLLSRHRVAQLSDPDGNGCDSEGPEWFEYRTF
jgi:hypothetical protein